MLATPRTNKMLKSMSRMRLIRKLKNLLLKTQLRLNHNPRSRKSPLLINTTRAKESNWSTKLTRKRPERVK